MMRTTRKHFEIFKVECEYWIDKLKLDNWRVSFVLEDIDCDAFAECLTDVSGYVATIKMHSKLDTYGLDDIDECIKATAKHEVIHLLLGRFSQNAYSRFLAKGELGEAEEELVRKLEKLL